MVRYDKEHKLATRRRITETAARRFKQDGIDGSGIAALMADAGLTNGAFYAHFASKEDLVANAIADELRIQHERLTALPPGRESLEAFVREYLSPDHRDSRTTGCPSAALLDEVGRCAPETRQAYTEGAGAIVDTIAAHITPDDPRSARGQALGLYTLLVGTLQLSRALIDADFSDEVLEQGIQNALTLLG
ncbi:TetR/AcrR family transcriptional regulator [Smaragdicoccus niigatensis]|uniref:TetR/AcrR family transcriptional regulator n=1 Tax=Smaragdicoccus niigatensis TaxID=359359 RepID=UPI0003676C2B|nr:TetR/AcrR family transcriptional regulator [Smaragdicoccus niigatensis]